MSDNGQAPTWTNITVKLGDLKPWENNPRQSTKKQAEKLLRSWREFGQVETIAVSPDLDLYNGHQRLSALLTVYGKDYVIEARQASRHLSEEEKRKLTITLHAGATGSWDWDNLSSWEPIELKEWGFDDSLLTDWRRDVASLGDFLESEEEQESRDAVVQIDRAAELQKEWGTAVGQLWRLPSRTVGNEHRLICGDCTEDGTIEGVMGDDRADVVWTDPPYGVEFQGRGGDSIAGDISYALIPLMFDDFKKALNEKAWIYICGGSSNMPLYIKMFERHIRQFPRVIVWDKVATTMRHSGYHSQYEFIYYGYTKGAGHDWYHGRGGDGTTDIWRVVRPSTEARSHLTEKPIELPQYAIRNSCPENGIVYEPFMGSGGCLIAAENLSRQCRAIEIAPGYVAVALQRYQDAFGITAELIDTL